MLADVREYIQEAMIETLVIMVLSVAYDHLKRSRCHYGHDDKDFSSVNNSRG